MACLLFGTKQLPASMLTYYQLVLSEQKIYIAENTFEHVRKKSANSSGPNVWTPFFWLAKALLSQIYKPKRD